MSGLFCSQIRYFCTINQSDFKKYGQTQQQFLLRCLVLICLQVVEWDLCKWVLMNSQNSSAGTCHTFGRMRDVWDAISRAHQRLSFTVRWTGCLPGLKCGREWTPGHVSSDGVPKTCTNTEIKHWVLHRENSWRTAQRQSLIDLRGIYHSAGHQQATALHSHGFIMHKCMCVCMFKAAVLANIRSFLKFEACKEKDSIKHTM